MVTIMKELKKASWTESVLRGRCRYMESLMNSHIGFGTMRVYALIKNRFVDKKPSDLSKTCTYPNADRPLE
jgi:hypothetical protein